MIRTLISPGINWNWYLQGDFNDDLQTVHIHFYERWHKYEQPAHPEVTDWPESRNRYSDNWAILEDRDRDVYGVRVAKTEYLVTNPGHIFGYRDFTNLKTEKETK